MTDQPMPNQAGGEPVTPAARTLFNAMLNEREAKGIETYGVSLHSDNGRDALQDLAEELIDGWQYLVQARIERAETNVALARWLAAWDALEVHCAIAPDEMAVLATEMGPATDALERVARRVVAG